MLMITVEIWPNGSQGRSRVIGRLAVANVSEQSDYVGVLLDGRGHQERLWVQGHRRDDGAWVLLHHLCDPEVAEPPSEHADIVRGLVRKLLEAQ